MPNGIEEPRIEGLKELEREEDDFEKYGGETLEKDEKVCQLNGFVVKKQ